MVRRAGLLLVLVLCACGEDEPSAPVPWEPIEGIFEYQSGDTDLKGASLWFQGHDPYMFRLTNPEKVDAGGSLSDIQEEGYYWTEDSLLTLDVIRHSPPGHIELYALAPGENVFAYALQGSSLTLSGEDWHSGDSWTTEWIAADAAPFDGNCRSQSPCAAHLDSFRDGAVLERDPDFSFALANPVEEAGLTVVERSTYQKTQHSITFYVVTRDPPDRPDSDGCEWDAAMAGCSELSASLLLASEDAGASGCTAWTQSEQERNDEPGQGRSLSGSRHYEIQGNIPSAGAN